MHALEASAASDMPDPVRFVITPLHTPCSKPILFILSNATQKEHVGSSQDDAEAKKLLASAGASQHSK
jgi:hypothetical protein